MRNRSINTSKEKRVKKARTKPCYSEYQETRTIIVPECMNGVSKLIFSSPEEETPQSSTVQFPTLFSKELVKEKRRKKKRFKNRLSQQSKGQSEDLKSTPVPFSQRDNRKKFREEKVQRRRQIDPTTCERDYSADEIEFMNALDLYKRMNGRMFPTCSEILEVIKSLGYVKNLNQPEMEIKANQPIRESSNGLSSPKMKPTTPFLASSEKDDDSIENDDYDSFYEYREPLMIY